MRVTGRQNTVCCTQSSEISASGYHDNYGRVSNAQLILIASAEQGQAGAECPEGKVLIMGPVSISGILAGIQSRFNLEIGELLCTVYYRQSPIPCTSSVMVRGLSPTDKGFPGEHITPITSNVHRYF